MITRIYHLKGLSLVFCEVNKSKHHGKNLNICLEIVSEKMKEMSSGSGIWNTMEIVVRFHWTIHCSVLFCALLPNDVVGIVPPTYTIQCVINSFVSWQLTWEHFWAFNCIFFLIYFNYRSWFIAIQIFQLHLFFRSSKWCAYLHIKTYKNKSRH